MIELSHMAESAANSVKLLFLTPFDLSVRFAFLYMLPTALLAYIIWLFRRETTPLLQWLFPKSIYTHRSNLLDIKLFIINRLMTVSGVFGALVFSPVIAYIVLSGLSGDTQAADQAASKSWKTSAIATVVIVVSIDFCKYWAHRVLHQWSFLWPFHAVHHSAEVLTPLTLARAHPFEIVVRNFVISVVVGFVQGVLLFVLAGEVGLITIGGANAIYFFVNSLGANLRHSHIWLSYGRVMEHILISPAQHQIHHSTDAKHHDKNYGSVFAIWDWAFGTLYIPTYRETLTFGLSDRQGKPIAQPHPTLGAAIVGPFTDSWNVLRRRTMTPPSPPYEDESNSDE